MSFLTKVRDTFEAYTVAPIAQVPGSEKLVSRSAAPLVRQIGMVENIATPFVVGAVAGPQAGAAAAKGIQLLNSRRAPMQQNFATDLPLPQVHTEQLKNPAQQAAYTTAVGSSNTPLIVGGGIAALGLLLALA